MAVVAFAVFGAAGAFLWQAFRPAPTRDRPRSQAPTVADDPGPLSSLSAGWNELPPPPDVRSSAATAWTGSELIVWGGYIYSGYSDEEPLANGYLLDPLSGDSKPLPPAPLSARTSPATAWTGTELIVWGGYDLNGGFYGDGAAYAPASGSWRLLPPSPIDARDPFSVWTGAELVVWGTATRVDQRPLDGAAYDPASDTWRTIAEGSVELTDGTAIWSGQEMIVFGAALHEGNSPETPVAIGAGYDPVADSWRRIADSELSPQASTAAWNGSGMVAWDYLNQSQTYDPVLDGWSHVEDLPLPTFECTPESVAIQGFLVGDYCGVVVLNDPLMEPWVAIGDERFAGWGFELVAADPVALLFGWNVETQEAILLAYRPTIRADGIATTPFVPEVTVSDGMVHMPLTFPDGSTTTLVYPESLALAGRGVQPDVSYLWLDDPPPRYPILFLHGPDEAVAPYVVGEGPLETFAASDGSTVELWEASRPIAPHRISEIPFWLVYRTVSWSVLVSVAVRSTAATVAAGVGLDETADGYPVVRVDGPIALSSEFGEGEGPEMTFGDAQPAPGAIDIGEPFKLVTVAPQACSGPEVDSTDDGTWSAMVCLAGGAVGLHIQTDDRAYFDAVVEGIAAEVLLPAP